ncbi:MAG: acetyl-CoA C-acyltransferase [Candidatus Methylomirabilales bacterium]
MDDVVILGAARTPVGAFGGKLASVPATRLGSVAAAEALRRAGVEPGRVDETIFGNVLSAGLGQAPARQVALGVGVPAAAGALTVNKVCGSGLMAVILAANRIRAGDAEIVLAGGMESMSRAPFLLDRACAARPGHRCLLDSILVDGLVDPYSGRSMGECGEACAARFGFSREAQDDYAIQSFRRARAAQAEGRFKREIVPVIGPNGEGTLLEEDEGPQRFDPEKLRRLKPAFRPQGTITAGNAPSLNDGGAAVVVASSRRAAALGLTPLARIAASAGAALEPEWFTIAPIQALRRLSGKAGWPLESVELFEINEAFAVVAMAAIQDLGLDPARVNVNGGSVALGHPIGATGARLLVALLGAVHERGARRGAIGICLGGGEALALAVERA